MPKIFISYRRDDSQWPAHSIHRAIRPLVDDPNSDVFIDVDNIPLGVNFAEHLESKVAQCDVLLALIGRAWLNAKDPQTGMRRLDDPRDFVRTEISAALRRGIPVVPVMLDGTSVPAASDLPPDLAELSLRNAVEIRRATFDTDTERLLRGIGLNPRQAKPSASQVGEKKGGSGTLWLVATMLGVVAVVATVWIADPLDWKTTIGLSAQAPREGTTAVVDAWFKAVDANNYEEAWRQSGNETKRRYDHDVFVATFENQHKPAGQVLKRTIAHAASVKRLPTGEEGEFRIYLYNTQFENAGALAEQLVLQFEKPSSRWVVFEYNMGRQ